MSFKTDLRRVMRSIRDVNADAVYCVAAAAVNWIDLRPVELLFYHVRSLLQVWCMKSVSQTAASTSVQWVALEIYSSVMSKTALCVMALLTGSIRRRLLIWLELSCLERPSALVQSTWHQCLNTRQKYCVSKAMTGWSHHRPALLGLCQGALKW